MSTKTTKIQLVSQPPPAFALARAIRTVRCLAVAYGHQLGAVRVDVLVEAELTCRACGARIVIQRATAETTIAEAIYGPCPGVPRNSFVSGPLFSGAR